MRDRSDAARLDLFADPGDDLVEHLVESRRRLEAQDLFRFPHIGHAPVHVVFVRRIQEGAGTQLDPEFANAFVALITEQPEIVSPEGDPTPARLWRMSSAVA